MNQDMRLFLVDKCPNCGDVLEWNKEQECLKCRYCGYTEKTVAPFTAPVTAVHNTEVQL